MDLLLKGENGKNSTDLKESGKNPPRKKIYVMSVLEGVGPNSFGKVRSASGKGEGRKGKFLGKWGNGKGRKRSRLGP